MSDNPKIRHNMMANAIRVLSMDAVQAANSGHPGLPMGAADIATVLFTKFLKIDPRQPDWADRDRFVLSAGHGSMLLYALHYLMGFEDMTLDEIKNFRQLGSRTAGHPEYGHAAGIETTTGPLGQGLATSVGMALAERMLNNRFGDDLVNHYTYVLASDGDLMEGISHEAISLAGHLKLSKLIVLYDDNDISIDGPLNLAESGDALGRFEAAGWFAERIDGHDPDAIEAAISAAQTRDKPTLIACKTTIGYGAPNKQGTSGVHGAPLGDEEISLTREALGWTSESFHIPSDILDSWRMAGLKHVSERKAWQERLDAQDSEVSNRFTRVVSGDLPTRLEKAVQEYKQSLAENPSKLATRKSSEDALKAIVPTVPEMIGGSADLTGSNNTRTPEQEAVSADNYGGSFIHYGIREFGMAAAMNGMALHGGFIPYSGTFLVFSDYSRPALRLAALMEQRVIHVLTHDSIGLGEDGPTHQPVEHLAALRAIPNLLTLRPADATETLECWQIALEQSRTPSAMALTRQGLPAVRLEYSEKNLSAKGAYELASAEGDALVTLLATGSEVHLAIEAKQQLEAESIGTRVISMPCFELFDKQKSSYRDDVLGSTPVRIAIEAAIRQGWDAYLRPGDGFIGMESFGASAPADRLFEHFGITVDTIVKNAKDRLDT
ncbi:MAG: transketolase [Pseudomonadota bacterium]|nr:transketolase [Pseudomonadota bacterium]